ncbi:MAG: hypothetical protein KAH31_02585 [Candidatus Sabulitectum sp.]|nr:hypothetical protein [Candidatus Sabulitectum sp.]
MSTAGVGAVGAAGYYASMANAVKAIGSIIKLDPEEFQKVLVLADSPLVVIAAGGVFTKWHKYVFSFKGLTFYCKSNTELMLPGGSRIIKARKISIPDI